MYPTEPTHTEELEAFIEGERPLEKDVIYDYIKAFDTTKMDEGVKYYFSENDINNRKIYTIKDGQKQEDRDATNNKLPSGWHKLLVDQKVGYLVGDPITIGHKDGEDIAPLIDLLCEDFDDVLPELIKSASNKGKEWLHPYIDPEGKFDYLVVPAQEVIPIYDNTKRKKLIGAIRFYDLDHDNITKVEFWTDQTVTYYEILDGKIYLDVSVEVNPAPHFLYGEQGYGWGKVPFVEFKNNEEAVSDLTFYKKFIDAFDKTLSSTQNTIDDIQDFVYVLKGYEGQDLEEFMTNLKRYKVISVSDEQGAGVDTVRGEIPVEAVKEQLNRIRESIFQFGQGVDVGTDKFGNSPSGIALKFLFSLLDMKANVLERKFTKSLKQFMWFVCEYADITGIGEYDNQKLTFTFNKSMLMNDMEQVQIAQMSTGIGISKQTIRENHPWVSDAELERERYENEEPEFDLDQGEDDE